MATKKDLIDAQTYSRRRLLAAFTSGAPGGKEVEPTNPMKAVIGGVVLAAMVILGGVFYGLIKPGLPSGWETNTVLLVKDSGARYLAEDGILYPVLNATSARLIVPADEYRVVSTDADELADAPIGPTIGIVGAPDDVPGADALVGSGWTSCVAPGATDTRLPGVAGVAATDGAMVAVTDGHTAVVVGNTRYAVPDADADAVLRAIGLADLAPLEVDSRWLNLFDEGQPLTPIVVEGAGTAWGDTDLVVGSAVRQQGSTSRFLVTPDGELAPMSDLAFQLYMLGTGSSLGGEREVAPAQTASLPTAAAPAGGDDWPTDVLVGMAADAAPCAQLTHDDGAARTTLMAGDRSEVSAGVHVAARGGALALVGGRGQEGASHYALVDESGTSYAMPGADPALLGRLGYSDEDATRVPSVWMQFFAAGPDLTVEAAGATPTGAAASGSVPSVTASAGPAVDATVAACEPGDVQYSTEEPPALALLQSDDAWTRSTGAGVTIAVVDSGIDTGNAHLRDAVVGGVNLVDDGAEWSTDQHGHGTAIAGLIAARPVDGSGVRGLAPDAALLSVRVFAGTDDRTVEAGYGPDTARLAEGIRWAVDHDADIVSVSLSDDEDVPALRDAVAFAHEQGALVVASAGNRNTSTSAADGPRYPAAYDGVLSVTATDSVGNVTDDSIHGSHVELAAPGSDVLTAAANGGDCLYGADEPSSSYATGYAAAAAALVKSAAPDATPDDVSYRLMASALRANPDARDDVNGWGLVQPYDALTMVPGADERGPANPATGTQAAAVVPPTVALEPIEAADPFTRTRALTIGAVVVGALALSGAAVIVVARQRSAQPAPPEKARTGMLDAARDSATRLLG